VNHPIVNYNGKAWMLEKIENGKAVLWRNGESVVIDLELLKYPAKNTLNS
jgi:hypothetical protein